MRILPIALSVIMPVVALAAPQNALPSCYDYAKIKMATSAAQTELFVVIDQTTPLDIRLQQSVANQFKPFLVAGNAFSVAQFSAFTQGHYTDVLVSAQLDAPYPQALRDDTGKAQLAKFDQCMGLQVPNAGQLAGGALKNAFVGTSSDVAKSDVLASLKDISAKVRQSQAKQKVVLIVSDMLENSSISSFYTKQSVRKIDPQLELKKVAENQLFADFGGARVYVLGAGLLAEDAKQLKGVYRDPKTMGALHQFWQGYFERSNAKLVEFGQPALLNPIH